jgi:DNA-binding CsgD family transcriptional regulator
LIDLGDGAEVMNEDEFNEKIESLTAQPQAVLKRLFEGKKDFEIARQLFISDETVRKHIQSIYVTFNINVPKKKMRQSLHALLEAHQSILAEFFNQKEDHELIVFFSNVVHSLPSKLKKDLVRYLKSDRNRKKFGEAFLNFLKRIVSFLENGKGLF